MGWRRLQLQHLHRCQPVLDTCWVYRTTALAGIAGGVQQLLRSNHMSRCCLAAELLLPVNLSGRVPRPAAPTGGLLRGPSDVP